MFSWLRQRRPEELRGTLVAIFVADEAGAAMRRVEQAVAVAGVGLAGDRYAAQPGHWRRTDACQVTLVNATAMSNGTRPLKMT